jgi:hypothetical protein
LFDLKLPAFELKLPKVKRMNMDVCVHNTTIQTFISYLFNLSTNIMENNYLSEFEQEFEMDDEINGSTDSSSNNESDNEYSYEVDDESENDEELESDEEFESDDELENDQEFENDYATWSRDGHYDRDREFEARLYNAIRSNANNELDTELEIDNILHEMEKDYFFGIKKNWLKKLKGVAKLGIPGYAGLKAISALGRLNIRNLLKNKLLQTAAGFIPGAGPIVSRAMGIASDVLNKADAAKQRIQDIVQVGKDAYQNLASAVPDAQSEMEMRNASKDAWRKAVSNRSQIRDQRTQSGGMSAGGQRNMNYHRTKRAFPLPPNARVAVFPTKVSINKRQQVIPVKPNSIVVVKKDRLIIWETK